MVASAPPPRPVVTSRTVQEEHVEEEEEEVTSFSPQMTKNSAIMGSLSTGDLLLNTSPSSTAKASLADSRRQLASREADHGREEAWRAEAHLLRERLEAAEAREKKLIATAGRDELAYLDYVSHEIRNLIFGQAANIEHARNIAKRLLHQRPSSSESTNKHEETLLPIHHHHHSLGEMVRALGHAAKCTNGMMRIVNDTLDARSAAQPGSVLLVEPKPCKIEDLLRQVADQVAQKLESKEALSLDVLEHVQITNIIEEYDDDENVVHAHNLEEEEHDDDADDEVDDADDAADLEERGGRRSRRGLEYMADADRITQVLTNFVSNAIKYTDGGTISISSREVAGGSVRFEVKDQGPGVPEDIRDRLFKAAYLQSSEKQEGLGTGLGLFLCRAIVEDSLGGTIGCTNDHGARFHFTVPMPRCKRRPPAIHVVKAVVKEAQPPSPSMLSSPSLSSRLRGARILVVDDSRMNRLVITRALNDAGAECVQAENGLKALELLSEDDDDDDEDTCRFDILCSDILMPQLSGVELVERIKKEGRYLDLRCVAFTGAASAEEVATYQAAGFHAVVQKQCRLPSIVNTVAQQLKLLLLSRDTTMKKRLTPTRRVSTAPAPAPADDDNNEHHPAHVAHTYMSPPRRQVIPNNSGAAAPYSAPLRSSCSSSSISSPTTTTTTLRRVINPPGRPNFSVTPILTPRIDTLDLKSKSAGPLTTPRSRSCFFTETANGRGRSNTNDFDDDDDDYDDHHHLRRHERFQRDNCPRSPSRLRSLVMASSPAPPPITRHSCPLLVPSAASLRTVSWKEEEETGRKEDSEDLVPPVSPDNTPELNLGRTFGPPATKYFLGPPAATPDNTPEVAGRTFGPTPDNTPELNLGRTFGPPGANWSLGPPATTTPDNTPVSLGRTFGPVTTLSSTPEFNPLGWSEGPPGPPAFTREVPLPNLTPRSPKKQPH